MEATVKPEEARQARLAALRARRESAPKFGPEETVEAREVVSGDFLVRTPRVEWSGSRGGRYYQPAYRVERLVETSESTVLYGGETEVRFTLPDHESVSIPQRALVVIRRSPR